MAALYPARMLQLDRPVAITMWDFSWLERRWPGAGYEDWDQALDELLERGYDAVRIDAYPHLLALDGHRQWELLPIWHFLDWGAPMKTRISRVADNLLQFIGKCRDRQIRVGLSTWFREDTADVRMAITDASHHARIRAKTLSIIERGGLLDTVLYVDLCNEWPHAAPFFKFHSSTPYEGTSVQSLAWIRQASDELRAAWPHLAVTASWFWPRPGDHIDLHFLDFYEPHIWMAHERGFYERVGYNYERYDLKGLENVAASAEHVYRANESFWRQALLDKIDGYADLSRKHGQALVTTECWGVVDYKDGPQLDWSWVKDLCELGTTHAAATGRWVGIATSNFCAPQFRGMWRDIAWHRRLTDRIKRSAVDHDLRPAAIPQLA